MAGLNLGRNIYFAALFQDRDLSAGQSVMVPEMFPVPVPIFPVPVPIFPVPVPIFLVPVPIFPVPIPIFPVLVPIFSIKFFRYRFRYSFSVPFFVVPVPVLFFSTT